MQTYDLIMLGVLLAATALGAWKGLAWQIASLASLVVSYLAALHFSEPLAPYLSNEAPLNRFLAMLLLYAASSLVIWILFRLVAGFINRLRLQEFDRQMGALVGAGKGALLCIVITFFAAILTTDPLRKSIVTSRSGYCIGYMLDRAPTILPKEVHDVLGPYIKSLDAQLEHDHVDVPTPAGTPVPANIP